MSCSKEQAIANFGKYSQVGSTHSEEEKLAISNGIKESDKYKASYDSRVAKIRAWHATNKGAWKGQKKKRTAEHNQKIAESNKNVKRSEETKRRMSESAIRKIKRDPEAWAKHIGEIVGGCRPSKPQRYLQQAMIRVFPVALLEQNIPFTSRFADIWVPSDFIDVEFDSAFWHNCSMHSNDDRRDAELDNIGVSTIRIGYEELGTPYEINKLFKESV